MNMESKHALCIEYRRDISGNHLAVSEYSDDYRVHMLTHNRIPGLLEVNLHEADGRQEICYEIGSMETLNRILDVRALNGEGVSRIITDLLRTVRELDAYMLDKDDLLLDPDYMYLNENKSLMLCYIPGNAGSMGAGLSELLRRMLAAVDNNDHDSVVLAYSLYQESLRENYVTDDLLKIIRAAGRRNDERQQEGVSYGTVMIQDPAPALMVAEPRSQTGEADQKPKKKFLKGWGSGKKLFKSS